MATDRAFGVEIEHGNLNGYEWVGQQVAKKFKRWTNCGHDGSGVELRSPILKGQSGFDELGEVMDYLREIGGYISQSDGMHVHHDARDVAKYGTVNRNPRTVWNDRTFSYEYFYPTPTKAQEEAHRKVMSVLQSYFVNQNNINALIDPFRHRRSQWEPTHFDRWKKNKTVATGRHNVHFSPHSTFEFRQFEGCLDPVKAIAWIEFGQHFIEHCLQLKRYATCAATAQQLLHRIGVPQAEILLQGRTRSKLLSRTDAIARAQRQANRR